MLSLLTLLACGSPKDPEFHDNSIGEINLPVESGSLVGRSASDDGSLAYYMEGNQTFPLSPIFHDTYTLEIPSKASWNYMRSTADDDVISLQFPGSQTALFEYYQSEEPSDLFPDGRYQISSNRFMAQLSRGTCTQEIPVELTMGAIEMPDGSQCGNDVLDGLGYIDSDFIVADNRITLASALTNAEEYFDSGGCGLLSALLSTIGDPSLCISFTVQGEDLLDWILEQEGL